MFRAVHQCISFLLILLLSSLDSLSTKSGDLAVSHDLRLITNDTADDLLCVRLLLSLRIERHCPKCQSISSPLKLRVRISEFYRVECPFRSVFQ